MKRKIALIASVVLAIVVLAIWAVPVFAADGSGATPPAAQGAQGWHKMKVLCRLLLIQDEAKVDALIATAKGAHKINEEQATKIKGFWTDHHQQFTKKVVLTRLLWAKDGTKVQTFLNDAVAANKIKQEQADKIMTLWNKLHTK